MTREMCGRTSLFTPQPELEARFDAEFEYAVEPRYNIAPGDGLAVIHNDDPKTITSDAWGFVPAWADSLDAGPRPINARAETIDEKPLFRAAVESRRALVLADGYYEWAGSRGGKQPYRIAFDGAEPFAMAGIWSRVSGSGRSQTTVAIVTTTATASLESIHDRMPVILNQGAESTWLHTDSLDGATSVLEPYSADDLSATPISPLVNAPANDSPAVLDPIGGDSGQTGLGDYGAD